MKKAFLINLLALISFTSCAQKETYDVISFSLPKNWQKEIHENGLQLSAVDKQTGAYLAVVVMKSASSDQPASNNFTDHWTKLVKGTVSVTEEPAMLAPVKDKDWDIISGQASYTDGPNKGTVTQITATGYGRVISLVAMTNTDKFRNELEQFLNSVALTELPKTQTGPSKTQTAEEPASPVNKDVPIVGSWATYILESNGGYYANGMYVKTYTAGYFRKEYTFYADNTYRFLEKVWSVNMKDIFFAYETGTWAIHGNTLTIKPVKGKNESWSKAASGKTTGWGNLVKATDRKMETIAYTYKLHYYEGTKETCLQLYYDKDTERDGTSNSNSDNENFWNYCPRSGDKGPLIDLPPGKKIETGISRNSTASTASQTVSSPLAGKIWEGSSNEKSLGNTGFNSGGFFTYQYRFNTDDTYRFVNVNASSYTDTKSLKYETGTYLINGNQLTIIPAKGYDEEWSKTGKISNGNSDVSNRAINDSWGKKLKSTQRKLERTTYTFSIEYWEGNKANVLRLQHAKNTEREGSPGQNNTTNFFETIKVKSVRLPDTIL